MKFKVGDLVKHKHGTMQGQGLILYSEYQNLGRVKALWTAHGITKVHLLACQYLEVISEAR
mgnify:CR=1 FL=1